MKITPSKNYKKPLYALGLTAALAAATLTGCTDPGKPVEAKREDLKQMRQELRELKAGYERKMKHLAKALGQVRVLMEEVKKC